ncbi:Predicted ATP-dependent endonuclease of the OLD family, contains P-loop ATPase and TOPRIM domains [Pseudomonas peli]|uniref:Predicted ATP-dependent endonuclease of the OLD family, contains P-loop ATPase and TOPRIM domains n=1 Tax=Pseudomonas peli TaxID=592361 RepID=A0AB37Z271_9PSED|nr:AAA family ATPase [Pseudomonas peli]NMZ69477.1 ATP-binding protein [Pseudomonas peli]SCW29869.1 Predicted ATP-dependent endonuclease of the OLD family, contains P-loop ATPase and TOPRIM domains [Pseudomonas peli]
MNLVEIRVRNFRSIETEQHLPIPGSITLVGPNNSGKTNLLRAVQVFFTGYENSYGYSRESDLTFGVGKARTSITATFDGSIEADRELYESIDELHNLQGTQRTGSLVTLTLYFTDTNTPVYSFFPNIKRPKAGAQAAQYSRTHISLVNRLLGSFSLHYVPSAKGINQIYQELLSPFLKRKVSKVIEPYINDIQESLSEAEQALNHELTNAGLNDFTASFSIPRHSIEELVSGFDFLISDPQKTPINEKGMGIQTTALLAAFRWITKQEAEINRKALWLLEEPESYLHPHLATNCSKILDNLAKDSTVIKTTHSMAFVPQDPKYICGTSLNDKNRTELSRYDTFNSAVSTIRSALGIKFGDFFNLAEYNVFLEGKSDREIFSWILEIIPAELYDWPYLRKASLEDFGGVKHLSGFLRATYPFIRKEQACVAIFDGDDAGDQERRSLQGYFGQKDIPFQPNEHFVSVRNGFPIEGLFPDEWIKEIYATNQNWFDNFSIDAHGQLEPFKIKDNKKENLQKLLIDKAANSADLDWTEKFCQVCSTIDSALEKVSHRLRNGDQ